MAGRRLLRLILCDRIVKAKRIIFMSDKVLNIIRYIGVAMKFLGLGIIGGLYIADSQFRYPYLLVGILIFAGECARLWARSRIVKKTNLMNNKADDQAQ